MFLLAGQTGDYVGACAMLSLLLQAEVLIAGRVYDADWFRWALQDKGIEPSLLRRNGRNAQICYYPALYMRRHRIESTLA